MTVHCFVTGTDTGVGKTLVSCAMLSSLAASGLRAVGMKPVAAGLERVDGRWRNEDVEQLQEAGNVDAPLSLRCPYLLRAPMSPHLAARDEGVHIAVQPLLTAEAIRARGLVLAGWVGSAIDPHMLAMDDNLQTLRERLDAPLLGVVPHLAFPEADRAARHLDLRALRSTAALAA